jgi:hypothetical protein
VNSSAIRSGVQNSARPVTACRPHGPPNASLACATTRSVQVGTTRSGHGGAATCGGSLTCVPTCAGDGTGPPSGWSAEDGPVSLRAHRVSVPNASAGPAG